MIRNITNIACQQMIHHSTARNVAGSKNAIKGLIETDNVVRGPYHRQCVALSWHAQGSWTQTWALQGNH